LLSQMNSGSIGISKCSSSARASQQLDILETLLVQVGAQLAHDLLRVLFRHQAEIYFAASCSRNDRLRPLALVAAPQSIDATGGQEYCFLQRLSAEIACQAGDSMPVLLLLLLGGPRDERLASACGWV